MSGRREPHGGCRDTTGGYLLIEALATLALSALVLAALLSLGAVLSRAVDRAAFRAEAGETGRRSVAVMAREVSQLARRRFSGEGDRFVFLGQSDRIVFALTPLQADGLRSPVAVAYQSSRPGELLRAEAPLPIGATGLDDVAFAAPRRLDVAGDGVRFAYVERLETGAELITDDWSKPSALPLAIRIDRFDPATGAPIASRRVPIVAQTEPGCAAPDKGFCSTAKKKPAEGVAPQPSPDGAAQQPGSTGRGQ